MQEKIRCLGTGNGFKVKYPIGFKPQQSRPQPPKGQRGNDNRN